MIQVGQLLLSNVRNYPDRTAVVSAKRELSYYELNKESNCIANALKKHGVKKGDAVAILLKNSVEWCVTWFACQKLGAVFVPLHVRLRADELSSSMYLAKCTALIFGKSFNEKAEDICDSYRGLQVAVCIGGCSFEKALSWEALIKEADDREAQEKLNSDDPSAVLFTSGTTGKPKGIMRTQEMMAMHAITLALRNNSPWENDVMMSTAPLYHIGGLQGLLKMVMVGGTYITLERIDPDEVLEMIEKYRVTQLQMLPPVTYERIYRHNKWQDRDRSSVWEVCISAGKCTQDYIEHVFEMFPNSHLRPSWGSTETCSVTCMQISQDEYQNDHQLVNAVGTVMPFTEVRIVDKNDNDVEPGCSGEAVVASPMIFAGYIGHRDEDDDDLFINDKWFRTGDIMRMDPKTQCYYFMDRKKDVIKTGGENVFALEVERVVQEHPSVQDCAVIGVPDERFGEGIAAALVLKPGKSIEADELIKFCKARLPSFKKPRYMAVIDKMPVNDVGKTAKPVLRENADSLFRPIV